MVRQIKLSKTSDQGLCIPLEIRGSYGGSSLPPGLGQGAALING